MKLEELKRNTTKKKYQLLFERYEYLYNVKRIREDDVFKQIGDEFVLSPKYAERTIRHMQKGKE